MKRWANNQLYRLCIAHFLETIREPEVLLWGMVFPILISIGLGLAFTKSTEAKFTIMMADSPPAQLDSLLAANAKPDKDKRRSVWKIEDRVLGNTIYTFERTDWKSAIIALKRGKADLIVTDSLGHACFHFDPLNAQAQLAYNKVSALTQTAPASQTLTATQTRIAPLTLKGVRYIDFFVPGIIAFSVMADLLWGISYAIIERRSQKLLRRMIATPMRKSNLLIAMMLVRILMIAINTTVIILAMQLIFGVEIQGSLAALALLFMAGNIAFTGISVLIASRTSKTEVGNGWINLIQMPMLILSGIFFSYHNFPEWSIGFIRMLPLTALADGFRSVFNEGAGCLDILAPATGLTLFGVVCFGIGMRFFKWH